MSIIEASTVIRGEGDHFAHVDANTNTDTNVDADTNALPFVASFSPASMPISSPTAASAMLDDKVFLALVIISGVLSLLMIRKYLVWLVYRYLIHPVSVRIEMKRQGSMTTQPNRWAKRLSALLSSQGNRLVSLPFASSLTLATSLADEKVETTNGTQETSSDWSEEVLVYPVTTSPLSKLDSLPSASASASVSPIDASPIFINYSPPTQHLPLVSSIPPLISNKKDTGDGSKSPVEPLHASMPQDWRLAMKGGPKGPHQIIIS